MVSVRAGVRRHEEVPVGVGGLGPGFPATPWESADSSPLGATLGPRSFQAWSVWAWVPAGTAGVPSRPCLRRLRLRRLCTRSTVSPQMVR